MKADGINSEWRSANGAWLQGLNAQTVDVFIVVAPGENFGPSYQSNPFWVRTMTKTMAISALGEDSDLLAAYVTAGCLEKYNKGNFTMYRPSDKTISASNGILCIIDKKN